MKKVHPAKARLNNAGDLRPVYDLIDAVHAEFGPWPDGIYVNTDKVTAGLPDALHAAIGLQGLQILAADPVGLTAFVASAVTLAIWRKTQGIYRLDPTVYDSVIQTPLEGDIPVQVLDRLPEWCVYVETPGLKIASASPKVPGPLDVAGFWARLEDEAQQRTLIIGLDVPADPAVQHQYIPLRGTLEASIRQVAETWLRSSVADIADPASPPTEVVVDAILSYARPAVNLLLYICHCNDFTRGGTPATPRNPEPVRTRRHGNKLFPAPGPTVWETGVRMGAALRAAYAQQSAPGDTDSPTGRTVRPHVRRAHWHTFLSGRRIAEDGVPIPSTERKRELRWVPPIPVNLDDDGELPAVIRRA